MLRAVHRVAPTDDSGQITVLVLGYTAIAGLLAILGIVASALFLDRRALAAAADDAAVAAAGAVDTAGIYANGLRCGDPLPIDPQRASRAAAGSVATDTDLRRGFTAIPAPATTVQGGTATVTIVARARVPLAGVVGLLDPGLRDGYLIRVTSDAQSPAVAPGGC